MQINSNRADRRRLRRKAAPLLGRVEDAAARRKLVELHQEAGIQALYSGQWSNGKEFAVCVDPYGLTWGTRDKEGFCEMEDCDQDGEVIYGFGGDGYNLLEAVSR